MNWLAPFTPPVGSNEPKPIHGFKHEDLSPADQAESERRSVREQQTEWACRMSAWAGNACLWVIALGLLVNGAQIFQLLLTILKNWTQAKP